MKKQKLTIIVAFLIMTTKIYSQGGFPGNNSTGGNFLGFNGTGINSPLNIRNDFNNQIRLFTFGARERVRIFEQNVSPSCPTGGGVGINANPLAPILAPGSFLHIGTRIPTLNNATGPGLFGWRNWMQLGTLMFDASDNMYVGLKSESTNINADRYDAVINWGDNISSLNLNPAPGPDYLRFIFTGTYAPGGNNSTAATTAGNAAGLEVMRFSPVGNMGIGNFYNNPLFPFRNPSNRLEILSDKATATINGTPQFRITHTQQNPGIPLTTGLFTDFITTNNGDIGINTFNNTNAITPTQNFKQRFVGINTNTPGNSLDVNSQFALATTPNLQPPSTFGAPTGWAGLRFTDLNSNSIPQTNPNIISNGVLSVDANGDVIYVPGGGATTANNGLQVTANNVQLGGDCSIAGQVTAAQLLTDRKIPLNSKNLIFADSSPNRGRIGIGDFTNVQCVPGNLVEIRLDQTIPNPISGLRLSDLAGAMPLASNNQVLSVDPTNGDVILTTAPAGGGALGNICGLGINPLTTSWEIPLANNNFIFAGQGTINNNVGIGVGTNCTPLAKLEIFQNSGNTGSTGLLVRNFDAPTSAAAPVIGIKSLLPNNNTNCLQVAGWFETGLSFNPTCNNLALYVPQGGGYVGIGYSTTSQASTAGGLLNVDGNIVANGINYPSDATLKNTVITIPNALQKIKSLRPVTYKWNTALDSGMAGTHAGFIAQEVDTVISHIVKTNPTTGKKSVAYTEIIPYLVKGMQQQQRQIEKQDSVINVLSSLLTSLTNSINACCNNNSISKTGVTGNNINQLNISLSDADVIVLNQNVPNPFAEQTTITYNVPAQYGFAQMVFKTLDGKIIKTVDITTKGKGQMNVFASDLSNGLYMYSLIVDGKLIDSKKMVKE